jgi:hypothetical protein
MFSIAKNKIMFTSFLLCDSYDRLRSKYRHEKECVHVIGDGIAGSSFKKHLNRKEFVVTSKYAANIDTPKMFKSPETKHLYNSIGNCFIKNIDYKTGTLIARTYSTYHNTVRSDDEGKSKSSATQYDFQTSEKIIVAVGSKLDEDDYQSEFVNKHVLALRKPPFIEEEFDGERKVAIIGAGIVGIEMAFKLRDKHLLCKFFPRTFITIHDIATENQVFSTMSVSAKKIVKDSLKENKINLSCDKAFMKTDEDYTILATGNKQNQLTNGIEQNTDFSTSINSNIFLIGDCSNLGYPKTAQDAYAQGKYLAQKLNHNKSVLKYFFPTLSHILFGNHKKSLDQEHDGELYAYYKNHVETASIFKKYEFEPFAKTIYIGGNMYCVDFVKWNYAITVSGDYIKMYHDFFD